MLNPALLSSAGPIEDAATISSFVSAHSSTTDTATYDFTSSDVGLIDTNTYGLLCLINRASSLQTGSVVTLGGQAAVLKGGGSLGTNRLEFWLAPLLVTGTKAIHVEWTGTALRSAAFLAKIRRLKSTTPTFAATLDSSMSSGVLSGNADCAAKGSLFAAAINQAAGDFSWTNIAEMGADVAPENLQCSFAGQDFAAAQSGLTLTATAAGPPSVLNPGLFAIAFR